MNKISKFIGIASAIAMMALGLFSVITQKWHFRSGNLASENQAVFFGLFMFIVGVILLIIQIKEKQKDSIEK